MSRTLNFTPDYVCRDDIKIRTFAPDKVYALPDRSLGADLEIVPDNKVLPLDLDVFSALPTGVYTHPDVKLFLSALRRQILHLDHISKTAFNGISLSKLCVTEQTEKTVILEWIFNYFRVYFGFDRDEGDFYGRIMNNPVKGEFKNENNKMLATDFDRVAEDNLLYVIAKARGSSSDGE